MSDEQSGFIVGAMRNADGTWDYRRAARVIDTDGSWAKFAKRAEEQRIENRRLKFVIPKDTQPGTAQRVWYELRNALILQKEILEKNPNNQRTTERINVFKLQQALLQHVNDLMKRDITHNGMSPEPEESIRKTIVFANALKQEKILSQLISEWEEVLHKDEGAHVAVGTRTYPISSILNAARDLSSKLLKESENYKLKQIPVPENWTFLVHGSNLIRTQWNNSKTDQLDADTLVVGGMGLSAVDLADIAAREKESQAFKDAGIVMGRFDTTRNYAHGDGTPLEIRVAFPTFHSRKRLSDSQKKLLIEKYGEQKVAALIELTDLVQWKNYKSGRHPLLPKGMRLIKVVDQTLDGQGRIIQYVPEVIMDVYLQELGKSYQD